MSGVYDVAAISSYMRVLRILKQTLVAIRDGWKQHHFLTEQQIALKICDVAVALHQYSLCLPSAAAIRSLELIVACFQALSTRLTLGPASQLSALIFERHDFVDMTRRLFDAKPCSLRSKLFHKVAVSMLVVLQALGHATSMDMRAMFSSGSCPFIMVTVLSWGAPGKESGSVLQRKAAEVFQLFGFDESSVNASCRSVVMAAMATALKSIASKSVSKPTAAPRVGVKSVPPHVATVASMTVTPSCATAAPAPSRPKQVPAVIIASSQGVSPAVAADLKKRQHPSVSHEVVLPPHRPASSAPASARPVGPPPDELLAALLSARAVVAKLEAEVATYYEGRECAPGPAADANKKAAKKSKH
jgi:hypothetical protein